jgi:hypothetical protein
VELVRLSTGRRGANVCRQAAVDGPLEARAATWDEISTVVHVHPNGRRVYVGDAERHRNEFLSRRFAGSRASENGGVEHCARYAGIHDSAHTEAYSPSSPASVAGRAASARLASN